MLSSGVVSSLPQVDRAAVDWAITRSKQWISHRETLVAIRGEVDRLLADKKDFQNWIDWAAREAWLAHSRRLGGLFDETYLAYVAKILGMPEAEASELHRQSKDPNEISRLVTVKGQDFDRMTRAYAASTIIRGRYHEEVARKLRIQLLRHPLRGIISKTRTRPPMAEILVPQSAWCLACIILYGAARQKRLDDRLRCWTDNVRRIRAFLDRGGVQLAEGTGHAAVDAALLVARRARIQIVDSRLDDFFEIVAGLGVGVLASIFLSPWLGFPAGAAARFGLKKAGFPGRFRNAVAFYTRETMLKDLAAGRIETEWANGV